MANKKYLVGTNGQSFIEIAPSSFTENGSYKVGYSLDALYLFTRNNNTFLEYPDSEKNYRYNASYEGQTHLNDRLCFWLNSVEYDPNRPDEEVRNGNGIALRCYGLYSAELDSDIIEGVEMGNYERVYIMDSQTPYYGNERSQINFQSWVYPSSFSLNNVDDDLPNFKYANTLIWANLQWYQGCTDGTIIYKIDKPIFTNKNDVKKYLETGEIGASCINMDVEPVPEQNVDTFNEYYLTNEVKKNGEVVFSRNFKISIAKGSKIYLYGNGATGNNPDLTLKCTSLPCKIMDGINPTWSPIYDLGEYENAYTNKRWSDTSTGDYYTSHLYTNIPIFANQTHGQQYEDGEITESEAENNGGSGVEHPSDIGAPINSNDVNLKSCNMTGTNIWSMTVNEINGLLNQWLYNPNTSIIDEIKSKQWLWNSDPINCISSLYYVPFDVTDFYNTSQDTFHCGSYVPKDASQNSFLRNKLITDNGNVKSITLFDTLFTPIYNDFRDYDGHVTYDLFLPFIGFVSLDPNKYIGKMVKCKMMFEATTHNVRYFMFVNGTITDRFDGSVGIDMPLLATAKGEKLGDFIQSGEKMLGGGLSLAFARTPSEKMLGSVNIISSGLDAIKSVAEHPSESYKGNFSSALNTYDVRYAYLRITIKETLKPSNLNVRYNYPSYYIGKFSALSGYCELADIRLNGFTGTLEELEDIKAKCKGGILC